MVGSDEEAVVAVGEYVLFPSLDDVATEGEVVVLCYLGELE